MKKIRFFYFLLVVYCFISCQTKHENTTVTLTDFTKDLISLYLDDIENIDAKNRKDEIIITTYTDELSYNLYIHSNDSNSYKYCAEDFIGDTLYLGHLIRVFGDRNSIFYSVNGKGKRKCSGIIDCYDPNIWSICLYRDLSFCKMRTSKLTFEEDISLIQDLAGKYFNIPETVPEYDNYLYEYWNVEVEASLPFSEDSLRSFISSNFNIKRGVNTTKLPNVFTVYITVNKNGGALFKEIESSGNKIVDREAIRVAKQICLHKFTPAIHRGEKVNSVYYINFFKEDINRKSSFKNGYAKIQRRKSLPLHF